MSIVSGYHDALAKAESALKDVVVEAEKIETSVEKEAEVVVDKVEDFIGIPETFTQITPAAPVTSIEPVAVTTSTESSTNV